MRLKKRYVAVLAVFTLFIAGCSYNLAGRVAGDGAAESSVTFSVAGISTNYDEMIQAAKNPASRSILPDNPFTYTSPSLTFVLTGTSNAGSSLPETTVTLSATHTFNLPLAAHVWDLTLTAYKDYNAGSPPHKPVLRGHCMVDVTNSNGTANFTMSTKGLTTPGTVKITGTVPDPNTICKKYKIGIYDAYSGRPITHYTDIDGMSKPTHAEQERLIAAPSNPCTFHYGDTTISPPDDAVTLNPGAYTILMVFYKEDGGSYKPIGSYPETVVVDPGYDLVKNIAIPDVLNKPPTKPENLRAYLVKDSEGTEGAYYLTKLTWDSARFETNYELELSTSSDDGTTFPAPTVYGFYETETTTKKNFAGSSIRYGGSLISGSHECTLKLELGKVYEVRLRAVNYIGESTWSERVNTLSPTPPADCTLIDIPTSASPKKHINRRRVTYNLNGGTLTIGSTSETHTGSYTVYESYQGDGLDLLTIAPSVPPAGANTLIRPVPSTPPRNVDFAGWLYPNTGASVSPDHTTPAHASHSDFYKHVNVYLKADFGYGLGGSVIIPGPITDIPDGKIKITYDKDSGITPQDPHETATHHLIIPKRFGGEITFITVKFDPSMPSGEYTNMKCTAYFTAGLGFVDEVQFNSAPDGNSCKFSTSSYITQTFTLKVSAIDSHGQLLSRTFLIDLQN